MFYRVFYSLLLAQFLLFSCKEANNERVTAILANAEGLLHNQPDSALNQLATVENVQKLGQRQRAEYYLLEVRAKSQANKKISADTLKLTEAIGYFTKSNEYGKLAQAYLLRGRGLYDAREYTGNADRAMLDFLEAKKYAEQLDSTSLLSLIHQEMGDVLYTKNIYNEALEHFKQARAYASKQANPNPEDMIVIYGRIGSVFNATKQYDSALVYQNQAISLMQYANKTEYNSYVLALLYKNTGYTYGKLGKYELVKTELLKAYRLLPESAESDRKIVLTLLSDAYIALNQIDSAIYYASQFPEGEGETLHDKAFRSHHWYKLYKTIGRYPLALKYLEAYLKEAERIYNDELSATILEIQKKYDKEQIENQYNQMLVQRLYLIIMFIVGILVGSLIIWSLVYRMKKKENELLKAQQSLDVMRRMLSSKENELANFKDKEQQEEEIADTLAEKDKRLRTLLLGKLDIARRIAQMNVVESDNSTLFMKQYRKIFDQDLMEEIDWANLSTVIDELFDNFSAKITGSNPDLSQKDMQLCCLIRAGFKPDEISVLLNYTQNTVRVKKSRLGRKMGFADYETFLSYIMGV